ncbi:hypothetical protein [Paenibacillus mucilaginosus]|uniref:Uncharacterized protein n=1 Tax=Paenibacillus mucilaginosus (strain KNP414) TaxID=1036673 RepID=F8FLI8_PAEMK|nr:hypothetical protein [Paenibacillus mucilaginosus]AEI44115.1 hypothetical protein KNP414_05591 [Paenibacillus mucilaginosus KNP414]MCG7212411.1 hypothetical protein [Paenibacillus mucilaginosus]WDM25548.1 hypothetical protein KCX80_24250 [Paenibacillus mucilaginosus]
MQEKIRRAGTGSQVLTLVFGMWLTAGMFLEQWENSRAAAGEADRLAGGGGAELLLYSGLAASILWLGWFMVRGKLLHGSWKSGLPDGYGAGLAGAGLFLLGSLGGLLWQLAGELQPGGIEEHYSPTRLLQTAGAVLLVTSPFRAVWRLPGRVPGRGELWPGLLSLALGTSIAALALSSHWMLNSGSASRSGLERLGSELEPLATGLRESLYGTVIEHGLAGVLLTSALLTVPLVWSVNRWKLPFGSLFILFTVPVLFMCIPGQSAYMAPAGIVTGLAADLLYGFLGASHRNNWKKHVLAALVPLLLTGAFLVLEHLRDGLGWPPALWSGAMVLSALQGIVLSHLVAMNKEDSA